MSAKVLRLAKAKAKVWERVSDSLVLHNPSGTYYARKFKAGRGAFFKSTGEKRKGRAQSIADQMLSEWMGGTRLATRRYRIDELCDQLDAVLEAEFMERDEAGNRTRRARTRDKDGTCLPIIKDLFGEHWADEIDELFWQDWVRTHGRKLNRRLGDIGKYLSKVLTFAYERKVINRKPKIENPDPPAKAPQTYSIKDIRLFLEHSDAVLHDLIVVGAECGVRPHENCGLQWDWIEISKKSVVVKFPMTFTKTRKAREIALSDSAANVIRRRYKARGTGPYVFPSPFDPFKPLSDVQRSRLWRRMLVRAGARPGLKFHWLRHTFFSHALLESGKSLPMVAAYGGNSPKILFDRYMAKDAERTREVAGALTLGLDSEE